LTKENILCVITNEKYELSDDSIHPIDPPLQKGLTIEEFIKLFRKNDTNRICQNQSFRQKIFEDGNSNL